MSRVLVEIGIISIILLIISSFFYFETKKIEILSEELKSLSSGRIIEESKENSLTSFLSTSTEELTDLATSSLSTISSVTSTPNSNSLLKKTPLLAKKSFSLPILLYHHIDYSPQNASQIYQDLTVSPETFEKQMEYLFKQNYRPITLKQLLNYLNSGEKIPERTLIITFDDGWKTQYRYAFPVLKKYNFPATFFVVVNYINDSLFMSWAELRELLKWGMEIDSHSLGHQNLTKISEAELKSEIQNSKIILEKKLGVEIYFFSYPYGNYNSKIIEVVRESNYLGALTIGGVDKNSKNIYNLKRIQVLNSLDQFGKLFPPEE